MQRVLETDGGDVCATRMYLTALNRAFKMVKMVNLLFSHNLLKKGGGRRLSNVKEENIRPFNFTP